MEIVPTEIQQYLIRAEEFHADAYGNAIFGYGDAYGNARADGAGATDGYAAGYYGAGDGRGAGDGAAYGSPIGRSENGLHEEGEGLGSGCDHEGY